MSSQKKYSSKPSGRLLRHLPEELINIRQYCPDCRASFVPEWLEPIYEPLVPIKPKYLINKEPYNGPARWIPQAVSIKCPLCNRQLIFNLPIKKMGTEGMLFGDEAYRTHGKEIAYTYSLIGADTRLIPEINDSINCLKSELCPSQLPSTWKLHMKDLCSEHNRKRHKIFSGWDESMVQKVIERLFQLIKETKNLFIYNVAFTDHKKEGSIKEIKIRENLRNDAYIILVLNVINEFTQKGGQPHLFFDADKPPKSGRYIQAWARNSFHGSQRCLLYTFLSRGIEVPEPEFVEPASHPCLELADFVSYVIARYHLLKWQNRKIELDPFNLGLATYIGFNKNGDLIWRRQGGYPWNYFYE